MPVASHALDWRPITVFLALLGAASATSNKSGGTGLRLPDFRVPLHHSASVAFNRCRPARLWTMNSTRNSASSYSYTTTNGVFETG